MYNRVSNDPESRMRITVPWIYWDGAFTTEELDRMCDYFAEQGGDKGTIVNSTEGVVTDKVNEKVRISNVKFHYFDPNNDITFPIFKKINYIIDFLNTECFNMDLNGYEAFQYTEYHAEKNGKYDFHMDTFLGEDIPDGTFDTRKLSMTLFLNDDYEGGEFQINKSSEALAETVPSKRGRILLFPSYMIHRVAPVTKGVRKSLVAWVTGPKFR